MLTGDGPAACFGETTRCADCVARGRAVVQCFRYDCFAGLQGFRVQRCGVAHGSRVFRRLHSERDSTHGHTEGMCSAVVAAVAVAAVAAVVAVRVTGQCGGA